MTSQQMKVTHLKTTSCCSSESFLSNFLTQLTKTFLQESAKPGLPLPSQPALANIHTSFQREERVQGAMSLEELVPNDSSNEIFKTDSTSRGLSECTPFKPERGRFSLMLPAESLAQNPCTLSFPLREHSQFLD